MQKILLSFALIILTIGVSGCMNNIKNEKSSKYENEILNYLHEKYSEKFVIEEIVRHTNVGESSRIYARTYSEKYPHEYFEVVYYLSANDVYMKEEVIEFLKKIDAYDENKLKPISEYDGGYFEDNYCNIVIQNKFDQKHPLTDVVYSKTILATSNFYPSIDGNDVSVDEYISSVPCSVYACTMIFVDNTAYIDNDAFVQKIVDNLVVKDIELQFIYIHYTNKDKEFIKSEFDRYYSDVVMHFKDAEYVTEYKDVFVINGIVQGE